jgi:hypothetical protein
VERTEFEKEVLEKNEKIADLKERLQVKFALSSLSPSLPLCYLLSILYFLISTLYSFALSIHAKKLSGT